MHRGVNATKLLSIRPCRYHWIRTARPDFPQEPVCVESLGTDQCSKVQVVKERRYADKVVPLTRKDRNGHRIADRINKGP